jgi:hypothetical protein
MTSQVLNKLLIAGAAIAAFSVAACSKPAAPAATDNTASAEASSNAMGATTNEATNAASNTMGATTNTGG